MKKFLILLVLVCSFIPDARSQNYKNEIGINLFKYQYSRLNFGDLNYSQTQLLIKEWKGWQHDIRNVQTIVSPHLFYSTRIYKNVRFRASFQFARNSYSLPKRNYSHFETLPTEERFDTYYLSEGLQYNFLAKRKLSPYIFTDIGLTRSTLNIKYFDENGNYLSSQNQGPDYEFGFTLGAGLRFQFHKRFSGSMEVSASQNNPDYLLSRLSINYHF